MGLGQGGLFGEKVVVVCEIGALDVGLSVEVACECSAGFQEMREVEVKVGLLCLSLFQH